ncbi:MAG TPA: glycosyltransferase [Sphingomicrobium sp.]|jgi:GT2 family glycosyltransferase|nr:glycosyltransferase [Sphingomicrobium sp.]
MAIEVSVIIPVFEDVQRLALCLDALKRQSLPAECFEIIVADNAPYPHVPSGFLPVNARLIHEPVPGSYAARNAAVATSRAPFVAFLDSDCVPDEDWLLNGLAALRAYPSSRITGPLEIFRESGGSYYAHIHDLHVAFPQRSYVDAGFCVTANLLVSRAIFDRVGPFDHCYSGGDARWGLRATAAGVPIQYREDVRMSHPARQSIAKIFGKSRRIAGSSHRGAPYFFFKLMTPPVHWIVRFRRSGLSWVDGLVVLSIIWCGRLVQAREFTLVRLAIKKPSRT